LKIIDETKLHRMVFSTRYWGTENVVAAVLAEESNVYNLCPHVPIEHLHQNRDGKFILSNLFYFILTKFS